MKSPAETTIFRFKERVNNFLIKIKNTETAFQILMYNFISYNTIFNVHF